MTQDATETDSSPRIFSSRQAVVANVLFHRISEYIILNLIILISVHQKIKKNNKNVLGA